MVGETTSCLSSAPSDYYLNLSPIARVACTIKPSCNIFYIPYSVPSASSLLGKEEGERLCRQTCLLLVKEEEEKEREGALPLLAAVARLLPL